MHDSISAVAHRWVEHDMPYSPDHMADIYNRLIGTPISTLALEDVLEPSTSE